MPRPAVFARTAAWLGKLADRWGRSLQLRVITATLVLSAVVVTVLGYVLMQHIVAGVYANTEQSASSIAGAGLKTAREQGYFDHTPSSVAGKSVTSLVSELKAPSGSQYEVWVTLLPGYQVPYTGGALGSANGVIPQLPRSLTKRVAAEGQTEDMLTDFASAAVNPGSGPVAGLAYGARFGSVYQLFYFFPLATEQASIAKMQQTMLLAGIAVVFLLAAIAWLVTRWVVIPVRIAAQGARRLSDGVLDERMEVRGTDELAALATSFNDMAASLQDKLKELEDLSSVQRQFVSDVSHELRTPLTTIRLASDVLYAARENMAQDVATSAELLQSQLERFESLLTDLLEISRYDANAATLDAEFVDVRTIVLQSADVAQQLAERRGTRIEFRLPAEQCIAEVDRRRVERILRNLLVNAVEHGEDRGVVVTAAMDSAAIAVSVRDYGVGLAPGQEQLVFDRFWRADPARARTSGGTGLGLSIALEDALLHGGWLEAWGQQGRGSVFRLTLPRTAGAELQGSPLPLSPYQNGVEQAELPPIARLAAQNGAAKADLADSDFTAADVDGAAVTGEPASEVIVRG